VTTAVAPAVRLPRPTLLWAVAIAWVMAATVHLSGAGAALHHDALIEGGIDRGAALGLFLVGWVVMIVAMMLPSSLPLIRLHARAISSQPRRSLVRAAFLVGYGVVWIAFGVLAFALDGVVHRVVDATPWLGTHPWVVSGVVLIGAGVFQFTELKEQCLRECRNPAQYLVTHYRRGVAAAFRLGSGHGLFCLGCCWALMLVSFAAGVGDLIWMALLTMIMVFEKTWRGGDRASAPIGVGFIALGVLTLAHVGWVPALW